MTVTLREVSSRRDFRSFLHLPQKLHRGQANWLPPIYADDRRFFHPEKNRSFQACETCRLLALRNREPVGRIMGIIHHQANELHGEKNARFGFMECADDQEVAHQLLTAIENWARARRMNKVVGPMGFTDQDPEGFMVAGFAETPTVACTYNLDFMNRLMINEGYCKEVDYVVYQVKVPDRIPDDLLKVFDRATRRSTFRIVEFTRRKELKPFVRPVFQLMNACFRDIFGFAPLDEAEMEALAKRYWPVVDPRFIKVALDRNNAVSGFIIGIPNLSDGLRKSKGRLLPLGFLKIIQAARKTRQLDLLLGGVKGDCQGLGIDTLLGLKTILSAQKAGFRYIDSHRELETNLKVRAEMERWGGVIYKRYRIYHKDIEVEAC